MKYFKMSQSGFLDFSGRNPVHETTRERERERACHHPRHLPSCVEGSGGF
jgi:hypothetical protein